MAKTPTTKPPAGRARRAASVAQPHSPDTLPAADLARLLKLEHSDPHAVLGIHSAAVGVVIRAFRPDAVAMAVVEPGGAEHAMAREGEEGLFALRLPEREPALAYRLRAEFAGGQSLLLDDPYRFLPTLGELDLHLFGEGRHERIYEKLGAHVREVNGVTGTAFALWAPNARGVSVVGDFNGWDGRIHPMRVLGASGVWELFVPGAAAGQRYKYELRVARGRMLLKADPFASAAEVPPATASVIHQPGYAFRDEAWRDRVRAARPHQEPLSVYELHLGSWRHVGTGDLRPPTYREAAPLLADYVTDMGFTHVELMPLSEYPFGGSWGYQVSGYYAPTSRHGGPDDLRFLVDHLHERGIGVMLDWVPAHFTRDDFALGRFDGTALYEHSDPRKGEHPDWGTYVFNFGRNEVRNFLTGAALQWLDAFHMDGLRLDAVASMLYLDYSRKAGEWLPNVHGGRENLEAIDFLRALNTQAYALHPGALMVAEESTAWPGVSRPTYVGGLGFGFKWNMGWMHDTLAYFREDPIHRRYHHDKLTFGLVYAWSENFMLPLSHDEVVHGKGSMLNKMHGDRWQKFANLRALYGLMWSHPGKKLLFMGGEIGQWREWNHDTSLDWHLLDEPDHAGLQNLVRALNAAYRAEPALWEADTEPAGFQWINSNDVENSVLSFMRIAPNAGRRMVCICNLTPVVREGYRLGLPEEGHYEVMLNTDLGIYGGSDAPAPQEVIAAPIPWDNLPYSAALTLPPLATLWLTVP